MPRKTRKAKRSKGPTRRESIRAMALAGPVVASAAAAELGCASTYVRKILRELEAEGLAARPVQAFGDTAADRLREALAEAGGEACTAQDLADAARCSVQYARKVLASLARSASIHGSATEAECEAGEAFTCHAWRATRLGAELLEADRSAQESERLTHEQEAELMRHELSTTPDTFDLF